MLVKKKVSIKVKEPRQCFSNKSSDNEMVGGEMSDDKCGFCKLHYNSKKSIEKWDWIQCKSCLVWYHEICVGITKDQKLFICGKCKKRFY